MKTDDGGGPAFPQWDLHSIDKSPTDLHGGMSLLDHFAGQALTGLLAHGIYSSNKQILCEEAWKIAEMMLATKPK